MTGTPALGALILQRRKVLKWSRPKLAGQVGKRTGEDIDQGYIAKIEDGTIARPDRARLEAIADLLEMDRDLLLRVADYAPEDPSRPVRGLIPELDGLLSSMTEDQQRQLVALIHLMPNLQSVFAGNVELQVVAKRSKVVDNQAAPARRGRALTKPLKAPWEK